MAKPGQSSFRRILLSRLLLLSVPVLLAGVYVTYRKARTALLDTARQNLTESAVRRAESIQESVVSLQTNLASASESVVLQSQSPEAYQRFVDQLAQKLPTEIQCAQLSSLETKEIVASTCGNQLIFESEVVPWPKQQTDLFSDPAQIYVKPLLPRKPPKALLGIANRFNSNSQLRLMLSAPVYDKVGQLQYVLTIRSALLEQERAKRRSLSGYPVVISEDGTILAHPDPERVGSNISQAKNSEKLEIAVQNAVAGREYFQHISSFDNGKGISIAGYSSLPSPVTGEQDQKWVILSVTPEDNALAGLKDIRRVLLYLTCGLIAANFLATLYVARELARPLEKLRDYALNEFQKDSTDQIPRNFQIREFNQLSEALEGMVSRLRTWAEELQTAWKEAQTANQLKNEFLASTSHELRTPLNGIIGCLRLVKDGLCDHREEEMDFLHRADDAAIHLLGIINDVLDIAKIEAGKLSVEIEPVDLRKLLDEVISLEAVHIQQKGLEFQTEDIHDVIPVRVDPAKLKQVLLNVIGNAAKFTEAGGIAITTKVESTPMEISSVEPTSAPNASQEGRQEENGGRYQKKVSSPEVSTDYSSKDVGSSSSSVVVTVKDTGIGIDPGQQHKLFRPFVMVDGSTTRKYGGTGLGLAISKNLIQMMGGNITLSSEGNGKGTTVVITLPIIDASLLLSEKLPLSNNPSGSNEGDKDVDYSEQASDSSQSNSLPLADTNGADSDGAFTHISRSVTGEL
ncbi:MAG: ATP-binding protein [Coleofasciculaceae cyanobacterium]